MGQTNLNLMVRTRRGRSELASELRTSLAEEGADGRGESPCRELIPGSDGRVGFISLETRKWGRALMFTEHLPMPDTVLGNLYVI